MAKDTFYFSHDYNSRTDEKIKKLIRKHGMLGYGIWWALIEDLYNNANALQTDYDGIAYDLHSDSETIKSVLNDFDLFVFDGEMFGSLSVERRIEERDKKSQKARESAYKRWGDKKKDANAMPTQCDSNAINNSNESINNKESNKYKKVLMSEIKISDYPVLNEQYFKASIYIQNTIRKNILELGAKTNHIDNAKGDCIDTVRLLIESDKYTLHEVRRVCDFLPKSDFWKKNILSIATFRAKFDKLIIAANEEQNKPKLNGAEVNQKVYPGTF